MSGVDYPAQQDRLHVVYHLTSMTYRRRLRVETAVTVEDPHVPSVSGVYPTADFHERETWDMFGIVFDGHPGLTRILMPDDWEGHPQRKDYPLGGIPVEYKGAQIPPPGRAEGVRMTHATQRHRHQPRPRPATRTPPARARPPRAPSTPSPVATGTSVLGGATDDQRMVVNMGPQHPSTHGVLRLVLELEGETVTSARTVIGYLHTGIEKNIEYRNWTQGVTFVTRMDYLSPIFNETAYCLAVEKLLGIEVPERATRIRVLCMELNRIALAPGVAGDRRHGARRADRDDQRLPRARAGPRRPRDDHRPAHEPRLRPSRRRRAGPARPARSRRSASCSRRCASGCPAYDDAAHRQPDLAEAHAGRRATSTCRAASRSASPARSCARAGLAWDLRKTEPYCGYENYDFDVPTETDRRLLGPLPGPDARRCASR